MSTAPQFSKQTLEFLKKASRQKKPDWLERNREAFESHVRFPLQNLSIDIAKRLRAEAPGYHFPKQGLGRLKRSAIRAQEYGSLYRSHVSFTATVPSKSRFDHNPSVFFMIDAEDGEGDEFLLAGGLYMPSSRQLRSIRESIAANPAPYEALFRSATFRAHFPHGFSLERTATRPPRGFDPSHSHLKWLKLQGYFVWKSYRAKEYASSNFSEIVAKDARQILRLNELLEKAISGRWDSLGTVKKTIKTDADKPLERFSGEKVVLPTPDF
jgi:uncharacterized protein (TIGR02453 family)